MEEAFDSLESLYIHVDAHALEYRYHMEIGDLFQKLRDRLNKQQDQATAQIAQYEVDAFNLQTKGNDLSPVMIASDADGNEVRIPDMSSFSPSEFDYFAERLDCVTNPRLKARYAHILWNSPRKRQQHAEIAVDKYVQLATHFESKDSACQTDTEFTGPHYGQDVIESLRCAFGIATNARVKIDEVISAILRFIKDFNPKSSSWYALNYKLLELMIDNRNHFDAEIQREIPGMCVNRADLLCTKGNLHGALEINKLGMKADRLFSLNTANWNRRIANCYLNLMEAREESPMVAVEWCQRAMDYYKAAGDSVKVEELAQKREKFGSKMEFQEVSTKIDQTSHIKWCEEMGKNLSAYSTDEILITIATDPNLLPLKDDMELQAQDSAKAAPLLSLMPQTVMDDRMHVVMHISTPEEKLINGILEAFKFHLRLEKVPLINSIILCAFRAGKLDSDKVIKFLQNHSWIGATLKSQRETNVDYTYCWLDQLRPAFADYFAQMGELLDGNKPDWQPIMAIDSLTLKFEGLIRDFAQLNGILTHNDTTDRSGRTVTREKDLSQLLYDSRIAELFSEDDLLFFRFLFIEHSGFTLRHRVAHCLSLIEDYNVGILQLLFVAIMRLAKYKPGALSSIDGPAP